MSAAAAAPPPPSFTLRNFGLAALGWSLAGALEVSVLHFYLPISGQEAASWRGLALWTLPATLLWILWTPGIISLARHFRVVGSGAARSLGVHLAAGCAAHLLTSALVYALYPWIRSEVRPPIGLVLLQGLLLDLLRYALVAAAVHAIDYYRLYRGREIEALRLSAELDAARLHVLKMQLQPHFLFNTLHAISELVYRDPRLADRALSRLADLLRSMLAAAEHHEAPLADELAFLESYVEIERIRRGGALEVQVDAPPSTMALEVPHLILQPLVENALRHGLRGRPGGTIRVTARRGPSDLEITIEDDGAGLGELPPREGLGLGSTRVRLGALYGGRASVAIGPRASGGTIVTLCIPAHGAALVRPPGERTA